MTQFPLTLEDAIAQAKVATRAALADGCRRLQVELVFSELKPMPIAEQFLEIFAEYGSQFKVYFPDAGAAALARRDWGPMAFEIRGITEQKGQVQPEDQAFLLVGPSSVEVQEVEALCDRVGDRPIVMLNPKLEDVATVGIGYTARQIRDRFISTFESCYYLCPLDQSAILRCYPSPWQVWVDTAASSTADATTTEESQYTLVAELPHKPVGDDLDRILASQGTTEDGTTLEPPKKGLLTGLQQFLRALSQ